MVTDFCKAGICTAGGQKICTGADMCVDGGCVPTPMALIPAGSFNMGCVGDLNCDPSEKPQHVVMLDAFYVDIYEVTVAKYKACVDAGKCTLPFGAGKTGNWGKLDKEQHPIDWLAWEQADVYCKWTDPKGHLPTEAQWEKAARGGLGGKKFPWGDSDPTCESGQQNTAVWYEGGAGCGTGSDWAVGTGSAKNGYGLYDMSGNGLEWTADWYDAKYYSISPATNPPGPASGSAKVKRGGDYDSTKAYELRASSRPVAAVWDTHAGFRCAKTFP